MTAEATRAELLEALRELSELFPEWRMGQTLANLAMSAGRAESGAIWDLEDVEALAAARRLIERNRSRTTKAPITPVSENSQVVEATPAAER